MLVFVAPMTTTFPTAEARGPSAAPTAPTVASTPRVLKPSSPLHGFCASPCSLAGFAQGSVRGVPRESEAENELWRDCASKLCTIEVRGATKVTVEGEGRRTSAKTPPQKRPSARASTNPLREPEFAGPDVRRGHDA
jgi:hypothetical protein